MHIAIIGSGGIGMRHLQSVAQINSEASSVVIKVKLKGGASVCSRTYLVS
ncbi:MAG: hypothetical protein FWC75_02405 [Oscillospiraceae bacterium]|nr:hypothetical protein [Oscillospiraceae bacterium]